MVFTSKGIDESWKDGGGRVVGQGLDPLAAPQAHADEEDGATDEGDVGVVLARLKIRKHVTVTLTTLTESGVAITG